MKQEKILQEKALHQEIVKKGVEFLMEIELGHAPPMEMIKKNIRLDDQKLDQYRNNTGVFEIVEKSKKFIGSTQKRVTELKTSLKQDVVKIQPYQGELKL